MSNELILDDIGITTSSIELFSVNQKVKKVKAAAFQNIISNKKCIIRVNIPNADEIESNTFKGFNKIEALSIPGIDYSSIELFGSSSDKAILTNLKSIEIKNCYDDNGILYTTKLGNNFSNLPFLTSITFPDSLTSLTRENIDGDVNLQCISLNSQVNTYNNVYKGLSNLHQLTTTLPKSTETLGINSLTNLNNISILKYDRDTTYEIKSNIFKNNKHISSIQFENYGNNLTNIQPNAFEGTNISEINISNSLISDFKPKTFKNCNKLQKIYVKTNTLSSIQKDAFLGKNVRLSVIENENSINASNSIIHMHPHGAFELTLQKFKENTLQIAEPSAFMRTKIQNNVLYANSLLSFGEYSFSKMIDLSAVYIDSKVNSTIPSYCFAENRSLVNVNIGNRISSINQHSFDLCPIKKITISPLNDGLKLNDYALSNINSLQEISFDKIYAVGNSAFKDCKSLKYTSTCLEGISSIGDYGFENAILISSNVERLKLNRNIFKNLGRYAFKGCRLKSFYCDISLNIFSDDLSPSISVSTLIPDPKYDKQKIIEKYELIRDYFGIEAQYPFEIILNDFTFNNTGSGNNYKYFEFDNDENTSIIDVKLTKDLDQFKINPIIPSKAIEISENAFSHEWFKTGLTSIYTNNVSSIADRALNDIVDLVSFNGDQLIKLGKKALCNCCNLQYFSAPRLTSMEDGALSDCISLKWIEADNLIQVGDEAFINCKDLVKADFSRLSSIGAKAFLNCDKIEQLNLKTIQNIGISAFCNMSSLKVANLGMSNDGCLSIPQYCFSGCANLDEIVLPPIISAFAEHSLKEAGSILNGKSNLSVIFEGKNQNDIESILPLDNNIDSKIGTKFYTNDFSYHSFITTSSNKIYKVPHQAFLVEHENPGLFLKKIDNSKLPYFKGKLEVSDLLGLNVVQYAAKDCTNLVTVCLDNSLTSNIEVGAFAQTNGLKMIDISMNYNKLDKDVYLSWTEEDEDVLYKFNDGVLFYDLSYSEDEEFPFWHFSSAIDVFNEDPPGTGRIDSVNDSRVDPTGIETIPDKYSIIGSKSLSTTIKINTLNVNNNITCIENFAFKDNYSISSFNINNHNTNLVKIGDDAFVDCCIRSIYIPYNSSRLILKGYGLNKSFSLGTLQYGTGSEKVEISPSAMIECIPLLENVVLPTNTTKIGKYAFAEMRSFHPAIRKININQLTDLTSIEDFAFYNSLVTTTDDSLSGTLTIPKNVKRIGTASFGYSSDAIIQELSGIEFAPYETFDGGEANKIESIGPSAFIRNYFKDIKFYQGNKKTHLTSIGDYAFAYPKNKFSIRIPSTIRNIGVGAFKKNIILNPYSVQKNILSVELQTSKEILCVMYDPTAPGNNSLGSLNNNYEAHNSISATDDTIFLATKGNYHTSFIYVSDNKLNVCPDNLSIDIIERKILSADRSVVSAFIPSYIYTIGKEAFKGCTDLTSIKSVNDYLNVESSAFYGCTKLQNINAPKTFRLSSVSPYSFYDCRSLSNVQILSNSISVGECAFYNCSSITAFQEIDQFEKRNYTLSVIDSSAFMNCTGISSFFIPSDISIIGNDVFTGCNKMEQLTVNVTVDRFKDIVDGGEYKSKTIKELIKEKFFDIRTDGKCEIIFTDAVYMNTGDIKIDNEYVDFRDDLSSIVSAFDYDLFQKNRMTYLNLSNIAEVDPFVFRGVEDIEMINFLPGEKHLTSIGDYSFSKCIYLASINTNNLSAVKIGKYAFANCNLLYQMTFDGDCLEYIGQGAFYNTSIEKLIFDVNLINAHKTVDDFLIELKQKIGWNETLNHNPMELPSDSIIIFRDKSTKNIEGKYDYLLNDIMKSDIDINRNQIVFIDKRINAIKPLLLVKPDKGQLPAIINNEFHMNVIGRWK